MHFWSIKGDYFLQNANNLNLKLFFFRLYAWPTNQVFCLYLRRNSDNESIWISLKSTFLALKKSCTSCPNGGVGGNLDKIQSKRTETFFCETFPHLKHSSIDPLKSNHSFSNLAIIPYVSVAPRWVCGQAGLACQGGGHHQYQDQDQEKGGGEQIWRLRQHCSNVVEIGQMATDELERLLWLTLCFFSVKRLFLIGVTPSRAKCLVL